MIQTDMSLRMSWCRSCVLIASVMDWETTALCFMRGMLSLALDDGGLQESRNSRAYKQSYRHAVFADVGVGVGGALCGSTDGVGRPDARAFLQER